ncbi:hypothetical protein D9756_007164 [Leucocoprinus leucothites]|uniref:Fungal-type protein kinase domain-containing protein n=1 Tax=Leucocoprinus leucothites TaxID=201217 RepID=A0A8H5D6Q9_9AGAR|nr:hypothetical protein D9756_007164 [Leucoagaricus leucothites]
MAQTIESHLLHGCVDLQRHLLPEAEEPGSFEEMTRALGIESLESKTAKAQEKQFRSPDEFVRLANALLVERRTKNLLFTDVRAKTVRDHPTSTTARPDIIAYDPQQSPYPPYLWSSVEFVAKFRSKGRTMEQCRNRTKAHAVYLLQARPDLRFVIALLVEYDSLELYTCSHLGFKRYRPKDSAATLDAIVEYLASGQQAARDQFLTRTKDSASQSMGAFDLMECGGENKPCLDYRHLKTSHPLGCRTHIFVTSNLSGPPPLVIKDQYKKKNRRWAEMEILKHIHKDEFPGVVRVTFFNEYNKSPLDGYVKTRIGLEDHGSTFLDLRTPREVLYAIYDLLEVTRRLFQDRQVLHRDISAFNFIIPSFERIGRSNKAPIGFIRHLLDTLHDPRAPPQGPFIILIDFDCAEIYDAKAPFFRQTGTPIFMARAVQFQRPLAEENWKPFDFQFIELDDVAAKIYQKFYPMRMEIFGNEKLTPEDSHKHIDSGFRHELRHDGESIVWVFLYWLMRAVNHLK